MIEKCPSNKIKSTTFRHQPNTKGNIKGNKNNNNNHNKDDVNLLLRKEQKFLRLVVIGVAKWGIKRRLVLRLIHPKISKENRSITNGKMQLRQSKLRPPTTINNPCNLKLLPFPPTINISHLLMTNSTHTLQCQHRPQMRPTNQMLLGALCFMKGDGNKQMK